MGTDIGGQQTPLYLTTSLSLSSTTLCHQGGVTDAKTRQNTDDGEDSNRELGATLGNIASRGSDLNFKKICIVFV